jgi:predicted Zn-dependent protease
MILGRILVLLALCFGSATAAAAIEPFLTAADISQVTGDEKRLWDQAKEFDDAMRKGGYTIPDDQFEHYLQHIADRLYPDFHGIVRLRLVKSPFLNAFALPNGSWPRDFRTRPSSPRCWRTRSLISRCATVTAARKPRRTPRSCTRCCR